MPEVSPGHRVWSVKSSRTDRTGRTVYYTVGTVTIFPDGKGKLRLHLYPDQEFFLYPVGGLSGE